MLALVLPVLIMLIVTRVAFHLLGALVVTLMIMIAVVRIYERPIYEIVLAAISLVVGYYLSKKLLQKKPGM
ncbi:MAG TPA: DUF2198 family protein [Bacilli bacterium]|nr:DUF2198 family protein [Bacilli bacterium]